MRTISLKLAMPVLLLLGLVPAAAAQTTGPPAEAASSTAASHASSAAASSAAAAVAMPRHISFVRWQGAMLGKGATSGTTATEVGVVIHGRTTRTTYRDPYGTSGTLPYDRGTWTSPWATPGFSVTELVASWQARTPVGTFIEISVRGRRGSGAVSSWDSLGLWAQHDRRFHRRSPTAQPDDVASVAVDTWRVHPRVNLPSWQLRVSLYRLAGSGKTPYLTRIGAMSSRLPASFTPSAPGVARGIDLFVPRYSQMIHEGEYPQYDGGGEAWCSPTSTSMVLSYWRTGPTPAQYAWVNDAYADPWVDHAARFSYAWGYDGTGDGPFNTAYAGSLGVDSFVTRLRSLAEAGRFIRAGIPLVASIAFAPGELTGSPLRSTGGHLLVIRGFTTAGHVIVNDPAAPRKTGVRRVYDRAQFERAWLPKTGGTVYVIRSLSKPLPSPRQFSNW